MIDGTPMFRMRRIEEPALAPDFSNLGTINLPMFKQALAGPTGVEVRKQAIGALRMHQQTGTGVTVEKLPTPLHQSGLECQTMALLNGIQAWKGRESVASLVPQVTQIRRRAEQLERARGSEVGANNILATAEILEEMGLLLSEGEEGNPIQIAQQLFTRNRFLGIANTDNFHAYTLVPLQASEDPNTFVLKIDSLGGRLETLSPEQFLNITLSKQPLIENQVIYTVV